MLPADVVIDMNQHSRPEGAPIPFIDVAAQRRRLGGAIDDAIARVLDHCQFILGPEVRALEADLAEFCGARHAITCASGTDALLLVLMAKGDGQRSTRSMRCSALILPPSPLAESRPRCLQQATAKRDTTVPALVASGVPA